MAGRSRGTDSQVLATILDPFRTIFVHSGPDRQPQLRLLRLEHCAIATIETSETSTLCVEARQMSVLATEKICPVATADICPVSAADICPVSTADICPPVSTEDIYPVSTEDETAAGRRPAAVLSSVETG